MAPKWSIKTTFSNLYPSLTASIGAAILSENMMSGFQDL